MVSFIMRIQTNQHSHSNTYIIFTWTVLYSGTKFTNINVGLPLVAMVAIQVEFRNLINL